MPWFVPTGPANMGSLLISERCSTAHLTRIATRLGSATLLVSAMSVAGCSIDSSGNVVWRQPQENNVYAETHAADLHARYWEV